MNTSKSTDRRGALFACAVALVFILSCTLSTGDRRVARAADQIFNIVPVAEGLEHPWGIAFLPDGSMLVTERVGKIRRIDAQNNLSDPLHGLPDIAVIGQGGLMDVVLHPEFDTNQLLYVSYAAEVDGKYGTRVARAKLGDEGLEDLQVIFDTEPKFKGGRHFGSRLVFDNEGFLYVTLGDRGYRPNGQDLGTHPGNVIRLHDDGSVPADNPFTDVPGARPEIFSYGHRNPQGMAIDRATNRIWVNEHGPQGGDELNLLESGANFGWAEISFGGEYGSGEPVGTGTEHADMAQPDWYWVPSIAPSGLVYYDSDQFPAWRDSLIVGALKFELLARLSLEGNEVVNEERFLQGTLGRIRDVRLDGDGALYVLTDQRDGGVFRLEPM